MEKKLKSLSTRRNVLVISALVLSSLSLMGLVFNIIQYRSFTALLSKPEIYATIVMLNVMAVFLFHIFLLYIIARLILRHINLGILGYMSLLVGIISIISFLFDWGALTDIGKEIPMGLDIGKEIRVVALSTIVQVVFSLLSLTIASSSISEKTTEPIKNKAVDGEKLFKSLNVSGVLCGLIGLGLCMVYFKSHLDPQKYKWIVIPFTSFVLFPYLVVLVSWGANYRKSRKESPLFDEKQVHDLKQAGFITWLLSFPVMFLVFIFNYHNLFGWIGVLWMPIMIFFSLLVFSLLSISFYKR